MSKKKEVSALKMKAVIRSAIQAVLKEYEMDEKLTFSLRDRKKEGEVIDYPERTICSIDGEVYNMLMNWAYKHKIQRQFAIDLFVDKFKEMIEGAEQRPKTADNASLRYWNSRLTA